MHLYIFILLIHVFAQGLLDLNGKFSQACILAVFILHTMGVSFSMLYDLRLFRRDCGVRGLICDFGRGIKLTNFSHFVKFKVTKQPSK